ncbi:response regulator receiver [Actinoplanes sp. SE50]|nr:putative transcriptional regulator ycf27 [Actinoplanes sp. SE50/110]ATO82764.1 response regulator receiver [Actinoplanes sp. SE50]SLM00171.1 response regulator receiver domain protein [Actinoplanes sp. SE50/110]
MGKVLVVDDEPDLRFLHRRILSRAGHEVTEAGDGASALEAVRTSPPDLVVTDMMMPVMGGVEFIRRLRADPATATIPVLAVSGDWQLATEADAALAKPCHSQDLLAAAEDLLRKGCGGR